MKKKTSLANAFSKSQRRLQLVKGMAKARAIKRQFKDKAQVSYSGDTRAVPDSLPVAAVDQLCFQEVVSMTHAGARKCLLKAGVLRTSQSKVRFCCWHCGAGMEAGDSKGRSFRCRNSRCKVRARIDDPEFAYTAFSRTAAGGCAPAFLRFLRTAYC